MFEIRASSFHEGAAPADILAFRSKRPCGEFGMNPFYPCRREQIRRGLFGIAAVASCEWADVKTTPFSSDQERNISDFIILPLVDRCRPDLDQTDAGRVCAVRKVCLKS
jgi:hypothetical protein